MRFSKTPMANKAKILMMVFGFIGFFSLIASGIATPIIKRNPGNIRSAGVSPFH